MLYRPRRYNTRVVHLQLAHAARQNVHLARRKPETGQLPIKLQMHNISYGSVTQRLLVIFSLVFSGFCAHSSQSRKGLQRWKLQHHRKQN